MSSYRMVLIVPLALVGMLVSGCTPMTMPDGDNVNDNTNGTDPGTGGEQPGAGGTLINVTALNSPVLSLLADDFQIAASDDFVFDDFQATIDAVIDAALIAANGLELTADAVKLNDIFDAALQADVPIVIENVTEEIMAAISGIGIDAEAVVVVEADIQLTNIDGDPIPTFDVIAINATVNVTLDTTDDADEEFEAPGTELPIEFESQNVDSVEPPADSPETISPDTQASELEEVSDDATDVADGIKEALDVGVPDDFRKAIPGPDHHKLVAMKIADILAEHKQRKAARKTHPRKTIQATGNASWSAIVSQVAVDWRPGNVTSASVGLNFQVLLAATTSPAAKYAVITVRGSGVKTSMHTDSYYNRGYYNERFSVEYGPRGTALTVDRHAPLNINQNTTVTTTTGFGVGVSGMVSGEVSMDPNVGGELGLEASYSASRQVTVNYPDFEILDETSSRKARWVYRLFTVAGGKRYTGWGVLAFGDEFDELTFDPGLHDLPMFARGTIPITNETSFITGNSSFNSNVIFDYQWKQTTRHVWRGDYSFPWFTFTIWSSVASNQRTGTFSVDFSRVQP